MYHQQQNKWYTHVQSTCFFCYKLLEIINIFNYLLAYDNRRFCVKQVANSESFFAIGKVKWQQQVTVWPSAHWVHTTWIDKVSPSPLPHLITDPSLAHRGIHVTSQIESMRLVRHSCRFMSCGLGVHAAYTAGCGETLPAPTGASLRTTQSAIGAKVPRQISVWSRNINQPHP